MKNASITTSINLQLPDLGTPSVPGTKLVHRTVSISVLIVVIGAIVVGIVLFAVNVNATISANGTLEPARQLMVHSPTSGIVARVLAVSGESVRAGQRVIQLDSTGVMDNLRDLVADAALKEAQINRMTQSLLIDERQQVESAIQADARLLKAKAYFRKSIVDYEIRGHPDSVLKVYKVGQHVGLDVAYSDFLSAEADARATDIKKQSASVDKLQLKEQILSLEQIRGQIISLQTRLRHLSVTSPANGIVITDQLDRLVGTSVHEGDPLFQIADFSCWQACLLVEERCLLEIKPGAEVKIEIPALSSLHVDFLEGFVRSIASEPYSNVQKASPDVSNRYRVLVDLRQDNIAAIHLDLKPGYSVVGKILTKRGPLYQVFLNSLRKNTDGS